MRFLLTWIVLAGFWISLSGYFDLIHLLFGLVSVTLVSAISWRHMAPGPAVGAGIRRLVGLFAYAPWLMWQVAVANVDVLLRVIGTRPVDPVITRIPIDLETEFGRVAMANSITLTPGTVTVEVEDGAFIVHGICCEAIEGVEKGTMQARVARVEGTGS